MTFVTPKEERKNKNKNKNKKKKKKKNLKLAVRLICNGMRGVGWTRRKQKLRKKNKRLARGKATKQRQFVYRLLRKDGVKRDLEG